jgi:hypothetical protein
MLTTPTAAPAAANPRTSVPFDIPANLRGIVGSPSCVARGQFTPSVIAEGAAKSYSPAPRNGRNLPSSVRLGEASTGTGGGGGVNDQPGAAVHLEGTPIRVGAVRAGSQSAEPTGRR